MPRKTHALFLSLLPLVMTGASAYAATVPVVPSAAEAVKATNRFERPIASPEKGDAITREYQQSASESEATFLLGGIAIRGTTLYRPEQFAGYYQPLIGKPVTVGQVQQVAADITKFYVAQGYGLAIAYVPAQTVDDGDTVVIQVDEGRIGRVEFKGENPPASFQNLVMAHINEIRSQRPVRSDVLEKYLLFINDLPGNTARVVLKPSAEDPGATDMTIYFVHQTLEAALATDNRGSRYLGPWQHMASASANGVLGLDERVSVRTVVSSPAEELQYADVQYDQPIGTHGTRVIATVAHTRTQPGEALKSAHVEGRTTNVQLNVVHPLLRSRLENIYIRGGVQGNNNTTTAAGDKFIADRVRSVRAGITYDRIDDTGTTIIDAELSRGIDGLGATEDGAGRSNAAASHDYTKIEMDISRNQSIYGDFSLLLTGSGQYALDTMLSSEQFLVGGPFYGTAYDPGEMAGDHGVAGKAELRYAQALNDPLVHSYQLYSFYDIGRVWRRDPIGVERKKTSLASYGAGIRVNHTEKLSSSLEFAIPLTRKLSSDPDNAGRIFGGVSARY